MYTIILCDVTRVIQLKFSDVTEERSGYSSGRGYSAHARRVEPYGVSGAWKTWSDGGLWPPNPLDTARTSNPIQWVCVQRTLCFSMHNTTNQLCMARHDDFETIHRPLWRRYPEAVSFKMYLRISPEKMRFFERFWTLFSQHYDTFYLLGYKVLA
jgi:hypothetical protein